jgi:hypothetical protein
MVLIKSQLMTTQWDSACRDEKNKIGSMGEKHEYAKMRRNSVIVN